MILCHCCNKQIKTTGKNLKTCQQCKEPVCKTCMINHSCKDCNPQNQQEALRNEYFKEKYLLLNTTMLLAMMIGGLIL